MKKEANADKLKEAFSDHLEETKKHVERLKDIGKDLDIKLTGETCEGMKGLINEAQSFISEDAENDVRDAGIIADAQRIEHYEIAAYGTVIEYAKALGKKEAARLLKETLKEEKNADQKLNTLAKDSVNVKAKV
jgi:ferritin-like metal-binding protein YciE